MELINQAIYYVRVFGIASVLICVLLLGGFVYFFKFKRTKLRERELDYSRFERKDTLEYVKFDDIYSGIIVDKERNRYVAGIRCMGFDFGDAESTEQLQAMRGYLGFLNVVDTKNIQYWQTARSVDLDDLIGQYKEEQEKINEKRFMLGMDYDELRSESEKHLENPDEYDLYYQRLMQLRREIASLGYQYEQLKAQVSYMEAISGEQADPHLEQCYLFDWSYNKMDYSTDLDEWEIMDIAKKQLGNMADSYMAALRGAGVKCAMLTGEELLAHLRRHMHPVSADIYKIDDVLKSAYDSLVVTSASFDEQEEKVNAQMAEEVLKGLA